MISDEMIRMAIMEIDSCILDSLPDPASCSHVFSDKFERKLAVLLRQSYHTGRNKAIKYLIAAVLAILLLAGCVMAVSPETRANVASWIQKTFGVYSQYTYVPDTGEETVDMSAAYYLNTAPEGYSLLSEVKQPTGTSHIYRNDSGQILQFTYLYGAHSNGLSLNVENYERSTVYLGTIPADVYISHDKYKANEIVWQDPTGNILFNISAYVDEDDLINLAGCVETD